MPDLDDSELASELRQLADSGSSQARPLPPAEVIRRGTRRRWRRLAGQGAVVAVILAAAGGIAGAAASRHPAGLTPPAGNPAASSTPAPSPTPGGPRPVPSRHPRAVASPSALVVGPGPTQTFQVTVAPSGVASSPPRPTPTTSATPSPTPTPSSTP